MDWMACQQGLCVLVPTCDLVKGCIPELGVVIDRMIAKDPFARYQFAEQVLVDLPSESSMPERESSPAVQRVPSQPTHRKQESDSRVEYAASNVQSRPSMASSS